MQPEQKKTAVMFHAKDDVPEVRRAVFELLRSKSSIRFIAAVKDKEKVLEYAISRKGSDTSYTYSPNELYTLLVRRIFKPNLHQADLYHICFAIRGNRLRTHALNESLIVAQTRFEQEHLSTKTPSLAVNPQHSKNEPCLQAADYFLWALQRLYEQRDDRYFEYIGDSCKLVIDIDDTRRKPYGEYFDNQSNRLSLQTIKPL
jgi:hypothetical protein